jgi:hypothetical protein
MKVKRGIGAAKGCSSETILTTNRGPVSPTAHEAAALDRIFPDRARKATGCLRDGPPEHEKGEFAMNRRFPVVALTAALVIFQIKGQTPPPSADPYANNPDAGKTQFPLAAPAGKDSGAITKAPPGAVNQ